MNRVKLGLIGLGYIGKIHLRNCLKLKSAELVAVADISKKALSLAKRMGIKKTFSDYQQLLDEKSVEAIIIALPTHLHAPCVNDAAESGKDIFLEKPLARNVEEGKDILSSIRKNGIRLMVGYPLRFYSGFKDLKEKIESGELGDIEIAYATNIGSGPTFHRAESDVPLPVPSWWFKKELTGGGALIDTGSHIINLLRWFFGKVTNVKSYLGYRFNLDFEDHATCILKFKSGQTALVNAGWFSQQAQIKVDLLGTVAHASATLSPSSKIKTAIQLMTGRISDFYMPWFRELSHFVACLKQDQAPASSAEDALKDLEIITQAYKNNISLD